MSWLFGMMGCMAGIFPLVFGGMVVLFIIIAIFSHQAEKKRREQLEQLARQLGLRFSSGKNHHFRSQFPTFSCLKFGEKDRYAYNIMTGMLRNRAVCAFDYHYATTSRDKDGSTSTHHHNFSAVIIRANIPLKPLTIRREGFFDKVKGFFGYDDIDFESAEFSRSFYVQSPDRRWAYDVIHQRTMEFLLQPPYYAIEFDTQQVITWHTGRLEPHEFDVAVRRIEGVLDRLPDYVKQQQNQPVAGGFA